MKRSILVVVAMGLSFGLADLANANPGMGGPPARTPSTRPTPPVSSGPRYPRPPIRVVPPVRVLPPVVVARTPPVFVPPVVPALSSGVVLTKGAWVGYNSQTGTYSVAFDSPGVSGTGILLNAGYTDIVRGPTDWTDATTYLKSIEAPGW